MLRATESKPRNYQPRHGMSGTVEYRAWYNNKKKLCEEWSKEFLPFYIHVGPRPTKKHTLDKINPTGLWEPGNVEWATPERRFARRRVLIKAYAAYKSRKVEPPEEPKPEKIIHPKFYRLSCPKCGIEFFSPCKNKYYCSDKCKAANAYFVKRFKA